MDSGEGPPMVSTEFPSWALQPRTETGAKQFGAKYPENDGRGTIVAILDSGVDPGAGGMAKTSDGKQKIIERIDCSGAGDVDMSKEVRSDSKGFIEGVSGRKLLVPEQWSKANVSEAYRVGVKRMIDLYPKSLKERILKERQERLWDPYQRSCVASTTKKIQDFDAGSKQPPSEGSSTSIVSSSSSADPSQLVGMEKLAKESLENEMEVLTGLDKKFKESGYQGDRGPLYDVVSFHDGQHWNVVIDTTEEGDLEKAVRLRPFGETFEFAPLTEADMLNVSVNVYENGNVVQLVTVCSSHGTHVASMAAACFPDAPEKNGLAPGAQIISLSIGDARLSGMETGTALSRAMTYIMQRCKDPSRQSIDCINMSYGEHSHWSNTGRVGELMMEVINKYGVVWIVSASNDGPALCTIGTPPDISTNTVIGVGAYVSPEMMVAMYSSREKLPGTPYTWSSRGPTIDGDRGVTICAPGGAITSVPPYNLRCSQLMNGTSMASPHVCGAVSLLISGLKRAGLKWSPFSVKRALAATAKPIPNMCHYGQGNGLLQIEAAFAHLVAHNDSPERDVRFAVGCFSNGSKGVHLRGHDVSKSTEVPITVTPHFLDPDNVPGEAKCGFNMKFVLTCSESWVKHPEFLDLMYVSRHFQINVDSSALPPGVHSAYVRAFDVAKPDKGTVFEIPVTVVVPEPLKAGTQRPTFETSSPVVFQPNQIKRHFIKVPEKATWAVVRVRSHDAKNVGKFVLHTVQLMPKTIVKVLENEKMFTLNESGEFAMGIAVKGGIVLELCVAKWWANLSTVEASYSVTFHGIASETKELVLHGADSYAKVFVSSDLAAEEVQPDISLKSCVQNYRPTEAKVVPLGERDVIPDKRTVYELQLTYNFSVAKATEITPNLSLMSDVLYESEFESQLWMLYNSQKQFVACGDAYPSRWSVKVAKDDYVLRAHVRHEKRDVLEKMMDLPMSLGVKLSSPISLDYYTSFAQASTFGKKANSFTLQRNKTLPLFMMAPSSIDKHAKSAVLGQYLCGTMTLSKNEYGKKADVRSVKYILNDFPKREKSKKVKTENTASYQESLFDHMTGWLAKLDPNSEESAKLYKELLGGDGDAGSVAAARPPLQAHAARLQALVDTEKFSLEKISAKRAEEAIEAADKILAEVKANELLAFFGAKNNVRSDAAETKEMEKKRGWFVEASSRKGIALCALGKAEEANDCLLDCLQFVDQTDTKVVFFAAVHAERIGHYGRAVKLIQNQLENKPNSPDLDARLPYLYDKLGWTHCSKMTRLSQPIRFPNYDYDMF